MSRAISTIVGTALFILVATVILAIVVLAFDMFRQLNEVYNRAFEMRMHSIEIANSMYGWWLYQNDNLTIHLESRYPQGAQIIAIAIVLSNGTTIALHKDDTKNAWLELEPSPGQTIEKPLTLPLGIGPGYRLNITMYLPGITEKDVRTISIALAGSVVTTINLKNYREVVTAANITYVVTQPNVTYSIVYVPQPLVNYTVAVLGFNGSESNPITPSAYRVVLGTSIQGDVKSLKAIDGNYLKIQSQETALFPDFSEWQYYKPIIIQEQTGTDLDNYTVRIVLNSSNFDFSKAKPDGSDIRFVLSDRRTVLNYWIEKWDPINQEAIVWVKIPYLPGGRNITIYMLYGNPDADVDPQHYGLTKVMEQLPANDGPNYKIQYQEWIMPENRFDSSQGIPMGWRGDDETYTLTLPFSFPFYSSTYDHVYVCTNGFVGTTYDGADWSSTVTELLSRGMIAPFWADLRTNPDQGYDIFVNRSYHDEYGEGVYIRWHTQFYPYNGEQNFAVVLYKSGLIRFDYGTIYGIAWTDSTPVIGISFGDNEHYTISSYNGVQYPSNYNSVMFWPRKVANPEPAVYVDPSDHPNAGYGVELVLGWSGITPATITSSEIYLMVEGSGSYALNIYENSTRSWSLVYSVDVGSGSWIDMTIPIYRYYGSGVVGLMIEVIGENSFYLDIDYVNVRYKVLGDPIVVVASNNTSIIYVYDLKEGSWTNVTLSTPLVNPAIAYDYQYMKFYIVNGTHLLVYDPYINSITMLTTLAEPSGRASFVVATRWFVVYSPGVDSSTIYLYNRTGDLVTTASLPRAVTPYTCTAYAVDRDMVFILYGYIGELYNITIDRSGGVTASRVAVSPSIPTVYPVGLAYDSDRGCLWVIGRGGSIHRIDIVTGTVSPLSQQPPYYPLSDGDRLVYYRGKLIHVRNDGTNELWIITLPRS